MRSYEGMSQSPPKNLTFWQDLWEKITSVALVVWAVCKWLWVAIILAILIGALSAILAADSTAFLKNELAVAAEWLFSPALPAKITLSVAVLFVFVSAASGLISWSELSKGPPVADYIKDILKHLNAISGHLDGLTKSSGNLNELTVSTGHLDRLARSSVEHNNELIAYRQLIQNLAPQGLKPFYDTYQQDIALKKADLAQQQALNENLKTLTTQLLMLQQADLAQQQALNENLKILTTQLSTLQQADLAQQQALNENLRTFTTQLNGRQLSDHP
jgi:hypothetical protein